MTRVKALTDRTIAERFTEVKDEQSLWGEIGEQTALLAKRLLESALEAELTQRLLAARYRRTEVRRGWRNGGYGRQIISCWGVLDIRMPRARQQLPPSQVLGRFQRRQPEVDQLLRQAFLRGVSTREVGEVLEPLLADRPSAQTVSRVAQALDAQVKRFHWRRLDDDVSYLLLDGISMKVKHPGGVSRKLVLVAYGIRRDGSRVLLDFRLATAESSAQWEAFLENLFRRGLEGQQLALVVSDGCPGLRAALEMVYPQVARQHCWVHKLRNVAAKLPRKHQQACLRGARRVYDAKHARQASERFRQWAQAWRSVAPKAVRCLEQDLEQLLAFYDCPKRLWTKIRTTNAIERSFREVRRRTRPMSCFQNNASCERIIYSVVDKLNQRYQRRSQALPVAFTQAS
jgi:transposase-like protein